MADHGHVFCAVAGSKARLIVLEGHVENPVEAVLDGPVAAHSLGGSGGGKRGRRDVIARLEPAAISQFGGRGDADHGADIRQPELPGKAAFAGEPIDLSGHGDGALLNPAMALVESDECVEAFWIGARKEALDLGAQGPAGWP